MNAVADLEQGLQLTPRWNAEGLIAAVAQDSTSLAVLMVAWMNAEALQRTLETGHATYWSRSRKKLWMKGEESGHVQKVIELRIDCDQDAVVMLVEQTGPACHTGATACFYRRIGADGGLERL
jgi:phosphoribosyl-AMP cyclohydrolase